MQHLCNLSLLQHKTDFFATAEAEARENLKLLLALDDFWLWNVPGPERRAVLCELAWQENLQRPTKPKGLLGARGGCQQSLPQS